jgi:alpha-tubulin suppressor-like RCC1 family protein
MQVSSKSSETLRSAPGWDQYGINIKKTIISSVVILVAGIGAVIGFGFVQTSTASAQAVSDISVVRDYMGAKFEADKKFPTIALSDNGGLSASGHNIALTGNNKVQTIGSDSEWKAALQSSVLKGSGNASWYCFNGSDNSVTDPKPSIGDCLAGVVEPSEAPSVSQSPSASASPSVSATASPTASVTPTATPSYSTTPTKAADDYKVVRTDSNTSCYITETAYCWGNNSHGQVGNGEFGNSYAEPVKVAGDQKFTAVDPGEEFTCAINSTEDGYCWGMNDYGQLGFDSVPGSVYVPTVIDGRFKFKSIDAGGRFACGVTTDSKIACWGKGYSQTPSLIPSEDSFKEVTAGGAHACAITLSDEAYCWGANGSGQFGDGTTVSSYVPVHVTAGKKFTSLSAGENYTCGIADNVATCWGDNYNSQLGAPSPAVLYAPVTVMGNVEFASIYAGSMHSCGLDIDGEAYCWGKNYRGNFGSGSPQSSTTPVKVFGNQKFKSLSVNESTVCGTSTTGEFYCWGANSNGQVGNGVSGDSVYPVKVALKGSS